MHGVGAMNSCGSMHGVVMHDNSSVHVNSCGALGHRNSCNLHAAMVRSGPAFYRNRARRFSGRGKSYRGVPSLWLVLHVLIILLSHLGQV